MVQLIGILKSVVWETTLIWSDIHKWTWKLWTVSTFCIVNAVCLIYQCTWVNFIFLLFYVLFENLRKKKWNYLAHLALAKWKGLVSWDLSLSTHDTVSLGSKYQESKPFFWNGTIFFQMLWMLIGYRILVEIRSLWRNLSTEARKVTRGKGYFESEQNVIFYGFSVIVNVFPVFQK